MTKPYFVKGIRLVTLSFMIWTSKAYGQLSIGPYAAVSSSKSVKPNNKTGKSDEVTTQRTTYGLQASLRMSRFFYLNVKGGVNQVDTSKKASAMRDEFKEIDFQKDLNVDPSDPNAMYKYKEKQTLGVAQLEFRPINFNAFWVRTAAGVRARKRELSSTNPAEIKTEYDDKIRYHAVGSAGVGFKLLRAFTGNIMYSFYFIKFPKTQPHEQEVAVGFGVSI